MRWFFIDRVTELVRGERARGVKCVTLADETLHDHFPGHPILPGVLVVEAAAQLAGFLIEATVNAPAGEAAPRRALLVQIEKAKFYEPARPGDRIDITATLGSRTADACEVAAEAQIGERRIARMALTFVLKRVDAPAVHEQRRALYALWTRDLDPREAVS